jgi:2-succinyl-5-enolpyruvyl-6-hydroxy-3-cyclohexene-1-carboxylate synthase
MSPAPPNDTSSGTPSGTPSNLPNDTYRLLGAFVDELARCGMHDACTSPGSRSTPLVLSLASEPRLRCHSHVDERCSGFFALGLAKASGLPVAIACTSGTAVAELLPAVVEAHEARVPLIVLSADRPPELREVGAGQTIDQIKLFGGFAKWFFEVGTHKASLERENWMRTLACRAWWTALEGRPGVVHLNFPLREPLVADELAPPESTGRPDGAPYVSRQGSIAGDAASGELERVRELLDPARRGVLVVGRHERDTPLGRSAAEFCERLGWPLLADPLSGSRRGDAAVAHYDALLRDADFAQEHQPDLVLRAGDLPVSKPLRTWLAGLPARIPQVLLDPEGTWQDPASTASHSVALEPSGALSALTAKLAPRTNDNDWLASWRSADERAAEAILRVLAAGGLSEPAVAAELGVLLPEQSTLFVASSMPVRDVETFWPVRADPPRVLCNRGANGIDGTVASALGAAAADRGPVVLLIGDVAFAYDLSALLTIGRLDLQLTIVLVNNEGGGIFDFLPVSSSPAALRDGRYERHISTPTGLDFAAAASLYGLEHHRVEDLPSFRMELERALVERPSTSNVVEVQTARSANVELHRGVWAAVSDSLR